MVRRTYHSVVEIPMGGREAGRSLPTLVLQDGEPSLYSLAWTRNMMIDDDSSPMHLSKSVAAVGLFYDFYIGVYNGKVLAPEEMSGLMRQFFQARAYGCSELGWEPVGRKTAKIDVRRASEFSKFCSKNFGSMPLNPIEKKLIEDLNVSEQMAHYAKLKNRKDWDLLYHLPPTTQLGQGIINTYAFNPKSGFKQQVPKHEYFPPDKILSLIKATDNLRDKLAFLILFFGGLRESELMHLFISDITVINGSGSIRIGDPESSLYEWDDHFRGKQQGLRSRFLHERYGIIPRNKLGLTDPLHSGWKGMLYAKNNDEANFEWLVPEVGELFGRLHHQYLREFRTSINDDHPHYFINIKNDFFGSPLKISNFIKSFYRAAKRVGLSPTESGVNPHGARHFYGYFCASHLRIPMEQTQLMMRHASITSTEVYYTLEDRVVRDELKKGYERLAKDVPSFAKSLIDFTRMD